MRKSYRAIGLVFAGLFSGGYMGLAGESESWAPEGAASAQSAYTWGPYTSEGMLLSGRNHERFGWPIGNAYLQPYAQASAVYEDNLFLNSQNKQGKGYTMFTPGAMLIYGNPRSHYVYLDYSADFTSLRVDNNDAFDGQTLKAAIFGVDAKSQYSVSHQYRDVRDVDVQVGTRLKRQSNTTTATYDSRLSAKTSMGVLGSYMVNQFDEGGYSDYREYNASGRLSWQAQPRTTLSGRVGHGWVDVDESRGAYGSAQYDEVAVGVFGRPRARLETSGELGIQHRYFEDDTINDVTREVGTIRVAGEPVERLRAWFEASAGLRPAINAPGYTVFDTRFSPGLSRRLFSDRVVGSASVMWGQTEYLGHGSDNIDPRVYSGRQDHYWGYDAMVDWWIGRYWSVGAGYSYIQNDSKADDNLVHGRGVDYTSYEAGRWMLRAAFNR